MWRACGFRSSGTAWSNASTSPDRRSTTSQPSTTAAARPSVRPFSRSSQTPLILQSSLCPSEALALRRCLHCAGKRGRRAIGRDRTKIRSPGGPARSMRHRENSRPARPDGSCALSTRRRRPASGGEKTQCATTWRSITSGKDTTPTLNATTAKRKPTPFPKRIRTQPACVVAIWRMKSSTVAGMTPLKANR